MIPIQFSHATGFPAESYDYFFQQLAPHPVSYVPIYGIGKYKIQHSWKSLVPELISEIESKHTEPIIGIGHSFGGVLTFWAAMERPDLFRKIILMDPPFMSATKRVFMAITYALGLTSRTVPIAKNAKKRRATFSNREEAHAYWKPKFLFRKFHPQCFEDYVKNGLISTEEGLTLRIPASHESKCFSTTPKIIGSTALQMPSYYLYPVKGGVIPDHDMPAQRKKFKHTTFVPIENGGHMFPLEKPHEIADLVKNLIAKD